MCWPTVAGRGVMSSPSPTSATSKRHGFPKRRRLHNRREFQRVYNEGVRISGRLFSVFLLRGAEDGPARVGLTVSRKVGGAVVRNRVKRLFREAVRLNWNALQDGSWAVLHARPSIREATFSEVEAEWRRMMAKASTARLRGT